MIETDWQDRIKSHGIGPTAVPTARYPELDGQPLGAYAEIEFWL